MEGER
jgi:hypothetical protein